MSNGTLIVIVVVVEALLHYFRWRQVLMGEELPRVAAYMLGVLGMMVPFTVWLIERQYVEVAWMLWAVIVSAGMAVLLCYGIDAVIDLRWKSKHSAEREQALMTTLRDDGQGRSS